MKKAKKVIKAIKRINKFLLQTYKNYTKMKADIKKIIASLLILVVLTACGSTRVSVDRPSQGTSTTITVTTNNPITTEVNPNVDANVSLTPKNN